MLRNRFITFFITFWCFLSLCGCAKKEPSTTIAENIKSDIIVVEKQLDDLKDNLPSECKNPSVNANLNVIQANLKSITSRVDSQVLACNTEKQVLEQENSKLRLVIGFLVFIIVGYLILKFKKIL